VGVFVVTGNCTGACSGGPGIIPEQYNIIGESWPYGLCATQRLQKVFLDIQNMG
jgi:hypothetical protein